MSMTPNPPMTEGEALAVDAGALHDAAKFLAGRYSDHDGWVVAIRAAASALTARPAALREQPVQEGGGEQERNLPKLVVTRGDGIPLPDQSAALEEFKRQCLRAAPPSAPVGVEADDDDELVERVARAIATEGFGRQWEDFHELCVHDTDKSDLREYALAAISALTQQPAQAAPGDASFQSRVSPWMLDCFGAEIADDQRERGDRLLEETLELLQSHGYDPARVATLTEYVYGRPVGEPVQEVGGVMVTLAAYCRAARIDMQEAGERELARILQPEIMEKIRRKQASKRGLHTPLPTPPGDDAAGGGQ